MASKKMNAADLKELAKVAPAVAAEVKAMQDRYRTRNIRLEVHPAGWQCYLGEGARYKFFAPNGNVLGANMVNESTMGAANTGVNYRVNEMTPAFPEGTWVTEFELFLGKPFIVVHYVGVRALTVA
jgi:hypothetical protein